MNGRNLLHVVFLICLFAGVLPATAWAQPQYSYTAASPIANTIPFNSGTTANFRQYIYYPTDFPGAPASGTITAVYFQASAAATPSFTNLTIKLGTTSLTSFSSTTYLTGLTTVYSGAYNQSTTSGNWVMVTLTNPYFYSNASNLVVEVSQLGYSPGFSVNQTNTGTVNRSLYGSSTATSGNTQVRLAHFGFNITTGPPCAAPTGLTSSGITMTTANFNWTAAAGSQGYEYAITTTSTPPSSGTTTNNLFHNATNLNNGTNYWFHVRNQCSASNSQWVTLPFSTVACPSIPLANVSVTGITTVAANISWTAVTGSLGYEWALTTSAAPPVSGTVQPNTTHNATGLFPGTTYYFHVRNQCTAPSNSVWTTKSFATLACPSAGAPTIVTNVPGTVTFSWPGTSVTGLTNYQYAVTQSSALPSVWQTTNLTTVTVGGLTPGTTYYAHVRSNCTNSQAPDQFVQFINPFPPCYAPVAISISNVNMHGANISWNSSTTVPAAQGYQYSINTNPVPPASGSATPDTAYTATNLTAGVKYYVYVRTHCGTTNYSGWTRDSFTTPPACVTGQPAVVTNVTSNGADISWSAFPSIYGYEYVLNNNPAAPTISGAAISYNNFSPASLFSGTTYYFHLRIRCDTFNFSPYITTSFTTQSVCTPPVGLVLTAVTPTTASFAWQPVPGAQQYQYTVSTSSTPVPGNTYSSTNNVKVLSLTPGTSYYFHVRANCSASDTSGWETVAFNTAPVSVGSVSSGDGFDVVVYPNPAKDLLHVELSGVSKGIGVLSLYDLSGKMLGQTELKGQEGTVDLSGLAQGGYLLRYRDREHAGLIRIQKL